MSEPKSQKFFTCKQEIMAYCKISEKLFVKFIRSGMPAIQIENRWYAHADNLDDFFKKLTKATCQSMSEEDIGRSQ